jgi:hypothetical protein
MDVLGTFRLRPRWSPRKLWRMNHPEFAHIHSPIDSPGPRTPVGMTQPGATKGSDAFQLLHVQHGSPSLTVRIYTLTP